MKIKYSYSNNDITILQKGEQVYLKGWIARKRNLGNKIFLILRDVSGVVQLIVDHRHKQYKQIASVTIETVVDVKGLVIERISKNSSLKTGDIEIAIEEWNVLAEAQPLPLNIAIEGKNESTEEHKLKYRYLDLRRENQKNYLIQRHHITQNIRNTLLQNNFFELETPLLAKSTPEGARDYLVPSRIYPNRFYALPQSPQIFKQLYMVAGFERYFQIARCFRDEDLRSNRQPEFTQIDIETSFFSQKEIMSLTEEIMINLFKQFLKTKIKSPFLAITYEKAMKKYGSDKPDLRFGLFIEDLTCNFHTQYLGNNSNFVVIQGIKINTLDTSYELTSSQISKYQHLIKTQCKLDLHFLRKQNYVLKGKFSSYIKKVSFLAEGECCFFIIDNLKQEGLQNNCLKSLGFLRTRLGYDLNLIDFKQESLLWIIDFPLLEFKADEKRYYAVHNPFTAPCNIDMFLANPQQAKANAYDLVWNGYEIGGGSLRNHTYYTQKLMFERLGFSSDEMQKQFGFLLEALKYGTPPHGGIALGLDRITMLLTKTHDIKDVIAFPKTQSAQDLMLAIPSTVDKSQLDILKLKPIKKSKKND
ncbi:MAG: aspartate--tRNA ligase [Weeping tea tree witches'-broom phytoplasma]|uniref:aspartate--tRNA ligase n=1 Tax=Candidatus Phytoplasma melaleucae TaxID=2982630 RepID=UPI00293B854D|nr:aspartate--tRNA ligase [Weeping tea tree witches'-broom phytoplasma]